MQDTIMEAYIVKETSQEQIHRVHQMVQTIHTAQEEKGLLPKKC